MRSPKMTPVTQTREVLPTDNGLLWYQRPPRHRTSTKQPNRLKLHHISPLGFYPLRARRSSPKAHHPHPTQNNPILLRTQFFSGSPDPNFRSPPAATTHCIHKSLTPFIIFYLRDETKRPWAPRQREREESRVLIPAILCERLWI